MFGQFLHPKLTYWGRDKIDAVDGMTGVKCSVNAGKIGQIYSFLFFIFPGTRREIMVKHA